MNHLWGGHIPVGLFIAGGKSLQFDEYPFSSEFSEVKSEISANILWDAGYSHGKTGYSNESGPRVSVNFGYGKYLGIQFHFVNKKWDGVTYGVGVGQHWIPFIPMSISHEYNW